MKWGFWVGCFGDDLGDFISKWFKIMSKDNIKGIVSYKKTPL